MSTALESAAKSQWDSNHKKTNYTHRFLESFPPAKKRIHELYVGGVSPFVHLKNSIDAPVDSAVELAGGRGDFALALCQSGVTKTIDLFDLSTEAVAQANAKAKKAGVPLRAFAADVNELQLDSTYDLAIFSRSLHHIEALEHVPAHVKNHLNPGGWLYINDYIGPSRMQWTDVQLNLMNAVLATLPVEKRIHIDNGKPKHAVTVTPVEKYLALDPSEGVRSAEIEAVVRDVFDHVEYYPLGGTITYDLFRGIVHNFDENNSDDVRFITAVLDFEHELIASGKLPSDFGLFLCRKD